MKRKLLTALRIARISAVTAAHEAAGEQCQTGGHDDDAEEQIEPSPSRHVDGERVVTAGAEEVVVGDLGDPTEDLERPDGSITAAANQIPLIAQPETGGRSGPAPYSTLDTDPPSV